MLELELVVELLLDVVLLEVVSAKTTRFCRFLNGKAEVTLVKKNISGTWWSGETPICKKMTEKYSYLKMEMFVSSFHRLGTQCYPFQIAVSIIIKHLPIIYLYDFRFSTVSVQSC